MKAKIVKCLKIFGILFFVSIIRVGDLLAGVDSPKADIGVVFSEILYDSAYSGESKGEWIELYNSTASAVNVGGWKIRDNYDTYTIPSCTVIPSMGYLVITSDRAYFSGLYGFNPHLSNLNLELHNSDDYLTLRDKQNNVRDRVAWESGGTHVSGWGSSTQPQADQGKTIVRSNLNLDTDTYVDWVNNQNPDPGSNTLPTGTPEIALSKTQLNFAAVSGGSKISQTFTVSNSDCGTLNWQVDGDKSWIECSPTSGTNSGTVTVTVDPSGLSEGTHTGTVTVTDSNASNSPQTVSITLTISLGDPQIFLDPTQLSFALECGETGTDTFTVTNSGGGTLDWTVTSDVEWLTCSPESGTGTGSIAVTATTEGVDVGTHTGTVTVSSPNAVNSPQTVSVTLTASGDCSPVLKINRTQLSFNLECGGETDSAICSISNAGGGMLEWTVTENINWVACDPESGINSDDVVVTVNTKDLSVGTYDGIITVSAPGATNSPRTISVALAVYGDCEPEGTPEIWLSRSRLYFGAAGGISTCGQQTFLIENTGTGALNWTAASDTGWLACSPASGEGSGMVTVSLTPSSTGLPVGTYTGTVTVSDSNASNSPQTVSVTLSVHAVDAPPFGTFATPVDNSVVRSSIPVTGWVLDDVGIESVKIYRHTNSGGGPAYVGDAVFVEGARPDVEQAYSQYPLSYKAGWGYMLLTYFLSGEGDGTYVLEAIASDCAGYTVSLGTKTVTVDNANAVKPFGAIDTPAQGGSASGSDYRNHGWVLTPLPYRVPEDGSTINVYIDGVYLGHPVYNLFRSDIFERFPGYANSSGAHAYFDIDTTAYSNGVHTIYWTATDSAGNSDGIGSRYFSILNTGTNRTNRGNIVPSTGDFRDIPVEPGDDGIITIEIKELERVEIDLFGSTFNLTPLPVGSTLDKGRGVFYWQPGPGFVGDYEFEFAKIEGTETKKIRLTVRILPR